MLGLREKGMLASTPSFSEAQRFLSRDSTACMHANYPQIRQPDTRDVRVAPDRIQRNGSPLDRAPRIGTLSSHRMRKSVISTHADSTSMRKNARRGSSSMEYSPSDRKFPSPAGSTSNRRRIQSAARMADTEPVTPAIRKSSAAASSENSTV